MDPFVCIVSDLHDWIFKYLSGNDLREMTEALPSSIEVLGKSRLMMKKVKLSCELYGQCTEIEKMIDSSARHYVNVATDFGGGTLNFPISHKLLKYLAELGPTLLELKISNFNFLSMKNGELFDQIDLGKLKTLLLHYVTAQTMNKLLNRCHSLTKLELKYVFEKSGRYPATIPNVRTFLQLNESLEHLELATNEIYAAFFEEDISQMVNFKLKRLRLGDGFCNELMPEAMERNFLKFLESQSQSLEYLNLTNCRTNVIELAFNKMPALTSLAILSKFDTSNLNLDPNEKIFELEIPRIVSSTDFRSIIRAVPKVTTLFSIELSQFNLQTIASNLSDLKELRYCFNDVPESDPEWEWFLRRDVPIKFVKMPCFWSRDRAPQF